MRSIVFLITDPLYLPLKRGELVCLPLESVMVRRNKSVFMCDLWEINYPWGRLFFRKSLFRFMLPQIARIFTDFLLLGQQLLADEWMCSPQE